MKQLPKINTKIHLDMKKTLISISLVFIGIGFYITPLGQELLYMQIGDTICTGENVECILYWVHIIAGLFIVGGVSLYWFVARKPPKITFNS